MTILHISTDFPDSFNPDKTPAIKNLLEATAMRHDHYIYSLNRLSMSPITALFQRVANRNRIPVEHRADTGNLNCWTYQAPGKGILLKTSMVAVAEEIATDVTRKGLRPALVHGHKVSMEGIIARHLADLLDIPFVLSVQGNSDRSIINARRDMWPHYKKVFHEAAVVFPFSPWAYNFLESRLGSRAGRSVNLPCITGQEKILAPKNTGHRITSAFHLKNWRLKNLPALVKAVDHIYSRMPEAVLDIYGGGNATDISKIRAWIDSAACPAINLQGALPAEQIQSEMNASAVFAMLSHEESFGMVFIEALLAGCPVIYPKDAAIDGYFEDQSFAVAAPANDQMAINEAIAIMLRDQEAKKAELFKWQSSGGAQSFQKEHIAKSYADAVDDILKGQK